MNNIDYDSIIKELDEYYNSDKTITIDKNDNKITIDIDNKNNDALFMYLFIVLIVIVFLCFMLYIFCKEKYKKCFTGKQKSR